MTTLIEKVISIATSFTEHDVPFAFGGALALAFHTHEPRATRDVDVNVFVTQQHARPAFEALPRSVSWDDNDVERVLGAGQVRVFWEDTPIDLFFTTHTFHSRASHRVITVPFAGITIPVLAAVDLAVFKAFFNRTKDWADIEAMWAAGAVDLVEVRQWIVGLLGSDDPRVERLTDIMRATQGPDDPRFLEG
jgi:hypothetical protein